MGIKETEIKKWMEQQREEKGPDTNREDGDGTFSE
jgi:hypothetical protein